MTVPELGSLTWLPATERPDLLGAPVAASLSLLPGPVWVAEIDAELADTAAFCAAYDVPLEASANCVVVAARRAGQTTLAACVVLATSRADVNGLVRRHLGARKASFAPQDVAMPDSATATSCGAKDAFRASRCRRTSPLTSARVVARTTQAASVV